LSYIDLRRDYPNITLSSLLMNLLYLYLYLSLLLYLPTLF
jgi:hypothetical protein